MGRATALLAAGVGVWAGARVVAAARRHTSLRDKVVLVTGGSRGLGLALARELCREGARVAITARDTEELGHVADEQCDILTVPCDLADPDQIRDMVGIVESQLGPIDVLINNAGIIQVGPLDTLTKDNFEHAMKVHFWAPWHVINAVLPSMRTRQSGHIVNIASIGGRVAMPHMLAYSSSKFALVGFSRGLRVELAKYGVRVTTVCPGLMRTGSARHATFKGKHTDEFNWFATASMTPVLSMQVNRAAKRILRGVRNGQAEIVLGWPAKIAAAIQGVSPGFMATALTLADSLLPTNGGIGTVEAKGHESNAKLPGWIQEPLEEVERANNESVDGDHARRS